MTRSAPLLCLVAALGLACLDEDGDNDPADLIDTSWTRTNTDLMDRTYDARITFETDVFHFELLDPVEGHQDTTTGVRISRGLLMIEADPAECDTDGEWAWSITEEDRLVLLPLADSCAPRVQALQGAWGRDDP